MICYFTFNRDNQVQEEHKIYYQKNNGEYKRNNKLYYEDHKEQYKIYNKNSYINNKQNYKDNLMRWKLKNPDYYLNWYNNNRDKILEKSKEHWRQQQNNKTKCEICNMELLKSSMDKHILSKRHIRNENKILS
jgi:hypothetical protein